MTIPVFLSFYSITILYIISSIPLTSVRASMYSLDILEIYLKSPLTASERAKTMMKSSEGSSVLDAYLL